MSTRLSTGKIPQIYKFIEAHRRQYSVKTMCHVLEVAPRVSSWIFEKPERPAANIVLRA